MDLIAAVRLVGDSERSSYPHFDNRRAVDHARNTIARAALDGGKDATTEAYRMVLDASTGELDVAVALADLPNDGAST